MNYIIMYATTILLKINKKPIRIFLGAVIGAVYAVICVCRILELYNSIIIKILVSIIIVYISTNAKSFKGLIKATLVFYLVSFTFGGIALALLYFVKPENILMKNGVYIGTYPIKIVLLGGILGYILISIVYSIIKSKYIKKKKICQIIVPIEKNENSVNALIDSGNFLKEPITGVPVVVIENEHLKNIIPKEILENVNNIIVGDTDILKSVTGNNFSPRFRLIPFNSLGKENGLLLGIKADFVKIIGTDGIEDKIINNVIIGLYDKKLSKERSV